jgi:hypothetical protein
MTTETKTYNGWTNYETWCVNLWLTNEPDSEQMLRMLCQMTSTSVYYRENRLKDLINDLWSECVDDVPGMFVDLIATALNHTNWREIVENHEHDDED